MAVNGTLILVGRWLLGSMAGILVGIVGWIGMKADNKVERHETRLQATELTGARLETDMKYVIKTLDEIKGDLKRAIKDKP